ncbi:pyridoxamine 5'-phosphate oxidase family protein [Amaricoccus macauensis]|uniref:pyridoxamine 5'-phosphate oxidase family protein n=1 Tax=Amaricoccus macauensis TaxID=57001 RepID=UPI003C7A22BD
MAKQFPGFTEDHTRFIAEQHIFFVATAAPTGRVNLSPKGRDAMRVLGPNRLVWLNLTGSGNETAAHLLESPRMTVMWCSFTTRPLILRAYGTARTIHNGAEDWEALYAHFPDQPGARQIYDLTVDLVQTSCGYAVPFMDYQEPRDTLQTWAETKGPKGVAAYWEERNTTSLDGRPTGI